MIGTLLLGILIILLVVLYKRLTKDYNYWEDRGLPYIKPSPLIGNMLPYVLKKKSFGETLVSICNTFKHEKVIGGYNFTKPILIVNDVEYAEIILIKEFSSFMDRLPQRKMNELRPLDKHLFILTGVEWKAVRSKLSPAFTTVRLSGMIPQINEILHNSSLKYISDHTYESIDLMSIVEVFSMSVRAGCIFGMDMSKLKNDSEFLKRVRQISQFGIFDFISLNLALWFPYLATKLDLSILRRHEDYFVSLLLDEFKKRSSNETMKNDFVETLLELKKTGSIKTSQWFKEDESIQSEEITSAETAKVDIDDDVLVSASFIFLLAGLDTLRSTSSMAIIELCKNSHVLQKLRNEIDTVMKKHNGQITYNSLKEMEYLDNCVKETLRLYPAAEFLNRSCVKEYTFDNGVTVQPGWRLFIPILKFQFDPNNFDEPHKFIPERFESPIRQCTYLPFGDGPRKCIAQRFAMMEIKIFLSQLLYNFEISLDPKTELPVKVDKWFFLRRTITPVYVKFSKRQH